MTENITLRSNSIFKIQQIVKGCMKFFFLPYFIYGPTYLTLLKE